MNKLSIRRGTLIYNHLIKPFSTSLRCKAKLKWSYSHGASNQKLLGTTIGEQLAETVNNHPDKTAAIFCQQKVQFTFQELLEQSDKLAAGLAALGVKRGDRVGIWAPNCPEWIVAQYGTARGGFILVNINPAYQSSELGFAMKKVGIKAIIAAETFKSQNYYQMLCEVCPELSTATANDIQSQQAVKPCSEIYETAYIKNQLEKIKQLTKRPVKQTVTGVCRILTYKSSVQTDTLY